MNDTVHPIRTAMNQHRFTLAGSIALLSLSALLELTPHLLVWATATEIFSTAPDLTKLWSLSALAFGALIAQFVTLGLGYILSHRVAFAIMRTMRLEMTRKLERVSTSFLSAHPSGSLKKTIIDDVSSLEGLIAHSVPELTSGVLVPLATAAVLAWVDWRLALLSIALLPVAFLTQGVMMSGFEEMWAKWHAAESRANEGILEFIRGVAVLKTFDRDASSMTMVREGIHGVRDLAVAMTHRSMTGYALFFSLLSGNLIVVLPAGLAMYLSEEISRSELVLFVALGSGILMPLVKLLFLFGEAQKLKLTLERVRVILEAPELPEDPVARGDADDHDGSVRLDGVSFTYPGRDEPAIDDVTLELPRGSVTAIVGESGAGKSTLVRLLTREFDPDAGGITMFGRPVSEMTRSERVAWVSHVSQATTLFDATVRENLAIANPEASIDAIEDAARAAQAHAFIERLPDGYDTTLGDRGSHLSGGERQRLAIARALLKDARLVLLDEVTANVDALSERGIQEGISRLARGRTVLMVAHRLRTIVGVDQILVMDGGRLVARGTHDELLERCEPYATLWREQERSTLWTLTGGES